MTTTFDHRDTGTPEGLWQASRLSASPSLSEVGPGDRLLVVAAHPDDETLGAGGLMSAASRNGAEVVVAIATLGESSHPDSTTHTPEQLRGIRHRETVEALAVVAPDAHVELLGLPDGGLTSCLRVLDSRLDALVKGCTHVVTPWSGDRHPDHEACALVGARLARRRALTHWEYPIWAWHWADPNGNDLPWEQIRILGLSDEDVALKEQALNCYVSQHSRLSDYPGDEAILSEEMLGHFKRSAEAYVVSATPASSPAYFDALYQGSQDPWDLDGRYYERRKRALLLAGLPRRHFRRAFEPGCATGLLTAELAHCCDEVVAWDSSPRARDQAVAAVGGATEPAGDQAVAATEPAGGPAAFPAAPISTNGRVTVSVGHIPEEWPEGEFDLVVLSEVGYYCPDLTALQERIMASLSEDGVLVSCHWRHPAADHAHDAVTVHEVLGASLKLLVSHIETDFLLHVWDRHGRSVAQAEGVVE